MSEKQSYFAEALNWDTQQRVVLEQRAARSQKIAWACGILCALSLVSITVLLPIKEFVPVVIRVDNATGAYDVQVPGEQFALKRDRDQRTLMSDVARYVVAREGFTRGEAEANYKTVYLMSCGAVRSDWDNYFKPDLNPQSPVNTMAPADSERVEIQNVTFLPTDQDSLHVAQVRFDKTVTRGTTPAVRTRYIATLSVRYERDNVPTLMKDLYVNAFGFCAVNYRRDQEGAPQVLGSPSTTTAPASNPTAVTSTAAAVPLSEPITPANIGLRPEGSR